MRAIAHVNCADIRACIAANISTPEDVLTAHAQDAEPIVMRHLARNPKSPAHILSSIAESSDVDTVLAIAENPGTPKSVLNALMHHVDPRVRVRVRGQLHFLAIGQLRGRVLTSR